jgi:hypothetical protein
MRTLRLPGLLALSFLPFVVAACGDDLPCPIPTGWSPGPNEEAVQFTFENQSCISICGLWVSPTSCDDWGIDVLPGNLHPGQSITLPFPPGRYDIDLEDCTGTEYIFSRQRLTEDYTFAVSGDEADNASECQTSITVVNNSDRPICHMWIADEDSQSFGYNWLADEQIPAGSQRTFIVPASQYDLKAEDCDFGYMLTEMEVEVEGDFTWAVP